MSNIQRPPSGPPGARPGQPTPGGRPGQAGQPPRNQPPARPGAPAPPGQRQGKQWPGGKPINKPAATNPNPAKGNLDPEFNAVSSEITRFRVDVQRYFAGDLHIPPEELRDRIAASLKKLRAGVRGAGDNFRLASIEAQFNSQVDLYTRKMRERELGGSRRPVRKEEEAEPDPRMGVVLGRSGPDNAVEILYKGLYLSAGQRNPNMDLERFRDYVGRQAEAIRAKTGCSDIQFRVEVEEGKLKLKAKPLR